jgi:hypothetical protein
MKTMRTKPAFDDNGKPTDAGGSLTAWTYEPDTGRLSKKYHDAAIGQNGAVSGALAAEYHYSAAGRLLTRKHARLLTAANAYQDGFLLSTTYDDNGATPGVSYFYDALGRIDTATNGVAKSEFTYANDLGVDTEKITYTLSGQASFVRRLDRKTRSLGRDRGWDLQKKDTNDDWVAEHSATYAYDTTTGFLHSVSDGSDTFAYGYRYNQAGPEDPRAGSATGSKQGLLPYTLTRSGTPALQTLRTYEAHRDALHKIENSAGTTTRSSYTY